MAENKNQHYVPRVHLRAFTLDGGNAAINLLNIDSMKAVRNAPVRNQCSGDYFYGKDRQLERAINSVENPYGEVVRSLAGEDAEVNAAVRIVLQRFIYLQYIRTEAASRKAAEMTAAMVDLPGSDFPLPDKREAMKQAVQSAMLYYAETMGIIDDLKVCILRNRTPVAFVTSDDPAILTNRLYLQRRQKIGQSFGLKAAGAIFLLPLSPDLVAIAYDPAVYRSSQRAGWIDVDRIGDVEAINQHQILNCASNLYFRSWEDRASLIAQVEALRHLRPPQRHHVVHAVLDHSDDWGSRYAVRDVKDLRDGDEVLVHISTVHPEPATWPSFLGFRPDAKAYSNKTRAGLTRRWCLDEGYVTGTGYRKVKV